MNDRATDPRPAMYCPECGGVTTSPCHLSECPLRECAKTTEAASSNGKTPYVHWTRPRAGTLKQDDATYGVAYARDPEKWLNHKRRQLRRRASMVDLEWEREKARFHKKHWGYPGYI